MSFTFMLMCRVFLNVFNCEKEDGKGEEENLLSLYCWSMGPHHHVHACLLFVTGSQENKARLHRPCVSLRSMIALLRPKLLRRFWSFCRCLGLFLKKFVPEFASKIRRNFVSLEILGGSACGPPPALGASIGHNASLLPPPWFRRKVLGTLSSV